MPKTRTSFKKGEGRKPGVQNKTTKDIKEAYRMLIEKNLDNLTLWLEKIAMKDPVKAIQILSELSEYVIPKLQRVEQNTKITDNSKTIVQIINKQKLPVIPPVDKPD